MFVFLKIVLLSCLLSVQSSASRYDNSSYYSAKPPACGPKKTKPHCPVADRSDVTLWFPRSL